MTCGDKQFLLDVNICASAGQEQVTFAPPVCICWASLIWTNREDVFQINGTNVVVSDIEQQFITLVHLCA